MVLESNARYLVIAYDNLDSAEKRRENFEHHKNHLIAAIKSGLHIRMSATMTQNGAPTGSCFYLDGKDEAIIREIFESDPYKLQAVWKKIEIHKLDVRIGK